jgi:photosystem II stability/assembly factor-like uncharacterized protein
MFIDGDTIWVVGESGLVAHTANLGRKWTVVPIQSSGCVYAIERDPQDRLWVGGANGMLQCEARPGVFATVENATSQNIFAIYFDPKHGTPWLTGINHVQRREGATFRELPVRAKPSIAQLVRTATGALIAVGRAGVILRSVNNGGTWKKIPTRLESNLEALAHTPYGLFVVGERVLVSFDDGQTFSRVDGEFAGHIWAVGLVPGALMLGGTGAIYRIATTELGKLLFAGYKDRDDTIAALAQRVESGDDGAQLVLEDALRERNLW